MTTPMLRTFAAVTASLVSLALVTAPAGHALDDCGVGMYYNNANGQCEPWAPVGVNFAPAVDIPVPVPVPLGIGFNPVPVGIGFDPGFGLNVPNIAPYLRVPAVPAVPGIPGVRVPPIPDVRIPPVPDVRIPAVPAIRPPEVRAPEIHAPEGHGRR